MAQPSTQQPPIQYPNRAAAHPSLGGLQRCGTSFLVALILACLWVLLSASPVWGILAE